MTHNLPRGGRGVREVLTSSNMGSIEKRGGGGDSPAFRSGTSEAESSQAKKKARRSNGAEAHTLRPSAANVLDATTLPVPVEEPDEKDHADDEEHDDVIDLEDEPVDLLVAQGVTEEVARCVLDKAKGDFDEAVMLIVQQQQLEREEKEMAKVMEESLKEAEEEAAKRKAEECKRKRDAPASFFQGSTFLEQLGEDFAAVLLKEDSAAKDDVIAMLEFERKCKQWFRSRAREVDEKFAAIAAELVANAGESEGEFTRTAPEEDREATRDRAGSQRGGGGGGGGGGGSGGFSENNLVHSMLVAHLADLQEAVLTMPDTPGGVPEVFLPHGTASATEEIDLTTD